MFRMSITRGFFLQKDKFFFKENAQKKCYPCNMKIATNFKAVKLGKEITVKR